jgi:hypothetical protein
MSLLSRLAILSGLILAIGACSGDDSPADPGGGGSGGTSGAGGASGSSGAAPKCPGPGYHETPAPRVIEELRASVVDGDGQPAAEIQATVCGIDYCEYGSTNADGEVVVCKELVGCTAGIFPKNPLNNEPVTFLKPAFKFAQGYSYVKWAVLLPEGTRHDLGEVTTGKFPALSTGVEMAPGGEAASNGVVIAIPEGASIKYDRITYENVEELAFRAVEIPTDRSLPAVDPALGFEILVGTTPVDTLFCPPARLSVPNSAGWPAGTEVEIFVHGVALEEEWAPYGGWGKVSGGAVSADGKAVVTHEAEGVPLLGAFGFRKK